MSTAPNTNTQGEAVGREQWGSRIGVVLAVAGSAVGLGNFLRFPGVAVNNGGGAFMIPYIISFLVVGIPIAWCEWTIGRLGGRHGQNNAPGIFHALSDNVLGRMVGTLALLVPVGVYMYYVLLEALCLRYFLQFASGGFAQIFSSAEKAGTDVVEASQAFGVNAFAMGQNGAMYGGAMLWLVLFCFVVNFFIIYRGVTKGIEKFCLMAMPLLILCAIIVLIRVLTLDNVVEGRTIEGGLGAMWNPDWSALKKTDTWLAAAGQIFFSLSVGFGLILCYSSYLRRDDDVVLTSLSASSTNEFCEVILGGMIIVPAAFLFLGPGSVGESTFAIGFFTVPSIMHNMPLGSFFGAMWFGLLFLAAVTSSISMLQPAIAFLEDGFGMRRTASVGLLGLITLAGAALIMYYSENAQALDFTDFWCNFAMILAALGQVIIFSFVIGAKRGVEEANRGASFKLPAFMPFMLRFITPTFLAVILGLWVWENGWERVVGMSPDMAGERAELLTYEAPLRQAYPELEVEDDPEQTEENVLARARLVLADEYEASLVLKIALAALAEDAAANRANAERLAMVARMVFVGFVLVFIGIFALSDIAIRSRIDADVKRHDVVIGAAGGPS